MGFRLPNALAKQLAMRKLRAQNKALRKVLKEGK
tara:strand:- start:327 stop:428 length:102 start_codon:yes stop_codon:yes gene_type:complete